MDPGGRPGWDEVSGTLRGAATRFVMVTLWAVMLSICAVRLDRRHDLLGAQELSSLPIRFIFTFDNLARSPSRGFGHSDYGGDASVTDGATDP